MIGSLRGAYRVAKDRQDGPDVGPGDDLRQNRDGAIPAPGKVLRKLRRLTVKLGPWEQRWRELWSFFDGEQFVERSAVSGELVAQETREGGSKPRWRPRLTTNRFTVAIVGEVSYLISRIPFYECTPRNQDPEKINGARTSEKVLQHYHDKLHLNGVAFETGLNAAVTGDGYTFVYWDASIGEPITDWQADPETGRVEDVDTGLRTGDVRVLALRQDQVLWPYGVRFEDAPYWVVRLVRPVEDVMAERGYIGPKNLASDAVEAITHGDPRTGDENLCFVYHYLERPCKDYPQGRWLQIANDVLIQPPARYPRRSGEPCLHRLPWIDRGQRRQRSLGLGELAIDIQRRINRIINQVIAWRNLALNPQWTAPENSIPEGQRFLDKPGHVVFYRGNVKPEQVRVQDIPTGLFDDLDRCYADIDYVVARGSAEAAVTGIESAQAYGQVAQRESDFRTTFINNLARWFASQGEHILELVAEHATEERLIDINGRFGVETIEDFRGEWIAGAVQGVRVAPRLLMPMTREMQEAKIMMFADKGWIPPHVAMAHLAGGTAQAIIDDFELHREKVHREIQKLIRLGSDPELLMGPEAAELIPFASPADNHAVFIDELKKWMLTLDFERQPELVQAAALNLLDMHQFEFEAEQMREAMRVQANAERLGNENAGAPQGGKPEPSRPSIAREASALAGGQPQE